ncbi:lmo0937 family membrane protein [Novosphingobium sp.]|nr:lmo0937 family membrane protein [Novosphingobium sp.]
MLLTIALVLFVLWALGVFAFKVTAGLIHLVLVVALVIGLVQLIRGRRV